MDGKNYKNSVYLCKKKKNIVQNMIYQKGICFIKNVSDYVSLCYMHTLKPAKGPVQSSLDNIN